MKRTTYDGREVTFITQDVQTDWDWVESAQKTGRAKSIVPSDSEYRSVDSSCIYWSHNSDTCSCTYSQELNMCCSIVLSLIL